MLIRYICFENVEMGKTTRGWWEVKMDERSCRGYDESGHYMIQMGGVYFSGKWLLIYTEGGSKRQGMMNHDGLGVEAQAELRRVY